MPAREARRRVARDRDTEKSLQIAVRAGARASLQSALGDGMPTATCRMRDSAIPDENPIQSEQIFGDVDYPARRATLIEHARRSEAPASLRRALAKLPDDVFESVTALNEALAAVDS